MHFSLTGHIINIDKENKAHSKCIVKDLFSSAMILIPTELLKDISLNDEVEIWGQLKGYAYNGKMYNNLFAKSIIKINHRYALLKIQRIEGKELPQFEILKYSNTPFSTEKINKHVSELEENTSGLLKEENTLKPLFLNRKKSALYYNAYSTSIEKSLQDGSICKEKDMIILNEGSNYFSKKLEDARFIFFKRGYILELTEIPIEFL